MRGMNEMVRQAQIMQKKIKTLQDELATRTVEGSAGGGMVNVTSTCDQKITAVAIDPTVISGDDIEMLQDLVMAATNDALAKAKETQESEMTALTGGMNIPGLF